MKYTNLGRTGMKVSKLCLGTMNFGPYTDEKDAFTIMDRALEAGINFFDTANEYGEYFGKGRTGWSEEIIGRWFKQGGGRREKVIISSKVYNSMNDQNDGPHNDESLSAYKIRRHIEGSLRRLQTDHIELYQMHHIYREMTWEEGWEVFQALVNQGKAYYIGSSNFAAWHIAKAQAAAEKRNFMGLVNEQHRYSLICRFPELEVLPAAKDYGLGITVWGPLGGGLLGGNVKKPVEGGRVDRGIDRIQPHLHQSVEDYSKFCAEIGESESVVALAWLLSNPTVTAPILGPRTLEQFETSLRAIEVELSEDILKKLDEIFPGPCPGNTGMPAPEAYAW